MPPGNRMNRSSTESSRTVRMVTPIMKCTRTTKPFPTVTVAFRNRRRSAISSGDAPSMTTSATSMRWRRPGRMRWRY
eukprot:3970678-Alexandrium_andersonii.AAC.1